MSIVAYLQKNCGLCRMDSQVTFSGAPSETDPLYDNTTDTIYVYSNYQLQLIASDTSRKIAGTCHRKMLPENIGIGPFLDKDV